MIEALIVEVDKNYRTVTAKTWKKFTNIEEAKKHCLKETWQGQFYYIGQIKEGNKNG